MRVCLRYCVSRPGNAQKRTGRAVRGSSLSAQDLYPYAVPSTQRKHTMTFIPRSSSLGGYALCAYRAAFDRGIALGEIPKPERDESPDATKYADLGTCVHYVAQKALGCEFPDGEEPPTEREWAGAARLFGDDMQHTKQRVEAAADVVVAGVKSLGAFVWQAERAFETSLVTGHIDLMSSEGTRIVDIKTTSRKPDHNRPKASHLWQMLAYYHLSGAKATHGYILYVDSLQARWSLLCPFDYTSPGIQAMYQYMVRNLESYQRKETFDNVYPVVGSHCASEFCPHVAHCRDIFLPGPGMILQDTAAPALRSPPVAKF